MNLENQLTPHVLLSLKPRELVAHLRDLATTPQQFDAISSQLLRSVYNGSIPPVIFNEWLPQALRHSPGLIRQLLLDRHSRYVRRAAIKALQRMMTRERCRKHVCDAIGGLEGLKEIFNTGGIREARELSKVIGQRRDIWESGGQSLIDDLMLALIPSIIPAVDKADSPRDESLKRPLLEDLMPLFGACSESFIAKLLSRPLPESLDTSVTLRRLSKSHADFLRKLAAGRIESLRESDARVQVLKSCLHELISSTALYQPEDTPMEVLPLEPPPMLFLKDLLSCVIAKGPLMENISTQTILQHVEGVAKYAARRRTPFNNILVLLQLGLSAAQTQERMSRGTLRNVRFLVLVAKLWSVAAFPEDYLDISILPAARQRKLRHPSRPRPDHHNALEEMLLSIIRSTPEKLVRESTLHKELDLLHASLLTSRDFAPSAQLPFIKLLCRHLPGVSIDLDDTLVINDQRMRAITWRYKLLNTLPVCDAEWLFDIVTNVTGAENPITYDSDYSWPRQGEEDLTWYCEGLMKVQWASEDPKNDGQSEIAAKLLQNVQQRAVRSRVADDRLTWAECAVDVAVSSKSVDLLNTVSIWARRFLRDPVVGPGIAQKLTNPSAATVLSCVYLPQSRRPSSISSLSALVQNANSLVSYHIETALLCLREPGSQHRGYFGFRIFLEQILSARISGVKQYHKLGLVSQADLVKVLLDPFILLLLEYEAIGIAEENRELSWDKVDGPCYDLSHPNSPDAQVLRLLDNYAKRRDELWQDERRKREPAVTTLNKGWPIGLPVQHLLPSEEWAKAAVADEANAPFVSSRIKDIVFASRDVLLSEVPSEKHAIARFVDRMNFAVETYVYRYGAKKAEAELWKVCSHHFPDSASVSDDLEALRLFFVDFSQDHHMPKVTHRLDPVTQLSMPWAEADSSITSGPLEWDPRPNAERDIDKPQHATLLQSRLSAMWFEHNMFAPFFQPGLSSLDGDTERLDLWMVDTEGQPQENREALALSSALFLDTLTTQPTSLLSKPFPEGTYHPRYPGMYLDYEFLSAASKKGRFSSRALYKLRKYVRLMPPTLLRDLAQSLFRTLGELPTTSPKYAEVTEATFELISILSLSDCPQIAVELGLSVVEQMPDASAWHRRVISPRLGKLLCFEDAENMMKQFATIVLRSLQESKDRTAAPQPADKETASGPDQPTKAIVKITTIKLLAQLLGDVNFVSVRTALDLLHSLFQASHHIDVRAVVIASLLNIFQRSSILGNDVGQKVYATLTSISEIAAGPNERFHISEDSWLEAEQGGELPVVGRERPLLDLFIKDAKKLVPQKFHESYVSDVVLPLLDKSAGLHSRWMRIFLSRVELSAEEAEVVEFGPFANDAVNNVLTQWNPYLPKDYLIRHRKLAFTYRDCCKLQGIDQKLKDKNKQWKATDAGQHWQSWFKYHQNFRVFDSLKQDFKGDRKPHSAGCISDQDVVDEYCQRAAIVFRDPISFQGESVQVTLEPAKSAFAGLVGPSTASRSSAARTRYRSIVEKMVGDIEAIRTPEWSANPERSPPVLLRRVLVQSYVLPFPQLQPVWDRGDKFIARVTELLEECAQSPSANRDFEYLEAIVPHVLHGDIITCALGVGNGPVEEHNSLAGCLKVQFASCLLKRLYSVDAKKNQRVKELAKKWKTSPNEYVRNVAWGMDVFD
ncbi:hypothetical protein AJ80_00028 [Polytolypa hystricis UAMH7299]|uniref:Uncharacterized protein n=1 Tax=Polytolypa hystricis (strain UAMH7299) TaxID=1447883 RepID=A0A2B7Z4T4_POLH7|nr:hypothetical protein AJ80_00028 [Polytolypa hystricis UAMH7299]